MLHRRDAMLRLGQFGFGALTLPQLLRADAKRTAVQNPGAKRTGGRAKSCILIYLWGGPPQQDFVGHEASFPIGHAQSVQADPHGDTWDRSLRASAQLRAAHRQDRTCPFTDSRQQ